MKTELEQIMLEAAKEYLQTLNDKQFLALTCNLAALCTGLVRIVYNEVIRRQAQEINKPKKDQQFKYLNQIVAAIFDRTTRRIKQIIENS